MPRSLSCQTSSPSARWPTELSSTPAIIRNNVVFPAPLGPNSAVIPSSLSESETCNEKPWSDKLRLVVRAVTIQTRLSGRRRLKA